MFIMNEIKVFINKWMGNYINITNSIKGLVVTWLPYLQILIKAFIEININALSFILCIIYT